MDWLKAILEKAVITDGKLDVEATTKSISAEFPKHAVPKADYNAKVEELKTANGTIETLRAENKDNAALQSQIDTYKQQVKDLQKAESDTKKTYAVRDALKDAGCTDPDYLIYKHGGLEKFTFDATEKPVGIEELVKSYKESTPAIFQANRQQRYNPAGGNGRTGSNPFAKETWNLTEQGRLYKEDPAQAEEMAAAAGVTI